MTCGNKEHVSWDEPHLCVRCANIKQLEDSLNPQIITICTECRNGDCNWKLRPNLKWLKS